MKRTQQPYKSKKAKRKSRAKSVSGKKGVKKIKIVRVDWLDAVGGNSWPSKHEMKSLKPASLTSVGILYELTDEYVKIFQTLS